MAIKPLPLKVKKFGRKLSLIFAIIFGVLFAGCFGTFIGLTVSSKQDEIIEPATGSFTSIKDVEDGFLYSTSDCHIILNDYEGSMIDDINCKETFSGYTETLGSFDYITSLSYEKDTQELFMSAGFTKDGQIDNYLFRFERGTDGKFVFSASSNYSKILDSVTAFTVDGDYLYALIRAGSKYCTINKIYKNDLSQPISTAYLYSKFINFDDDDQPIGVSYEMSVNDTIYSLHVIDEYIYVVSNKGVYSINHNKLANYPSNLKDEFNFTSKDVEDSLKGMKFSDYVYFLYSDTGNSPRGAFEVGNECYFVTSRLSMAHFNYENLDKEFPTDGSDPYVFEATLGDIQFNEAFPENRNALFYNPDNKTGASITNLGNTITLIDFNNINNPEILFTDVADINISDVVIGKDGNKIFYLCQNSQLSNSNTARILKTKDVQGTYSKINSGKYTPALLTCSIIFLFFTIIASFCATNTLFLEKFLGFLKNVKMNWVAYLILAICLTLLALFCYYPAVGSISMSFFNYKNNEPVVWNNFENYKLIFSDPQILKSVGNMFIFLVTDIITAIIPPLIFAFFLTVMKSKKMSAVTRTLLFLPSVIPGITKMMIWQNGIYGEYGVINNIINLFNGKPVMFFDGSNFDIWALILMGFPYVGSYLVFYGALMNVPSSYYEAAELEGLNVWKRFVSIDIPLIKPQIKYVVILTIIASVQNFGRTYMINSSLFTTRTPIHIMYDYINKGNYGLSSAIATLLFLMLLVFTIFNLRKQKEQLGDSI